MVGLGDGRALGRCVGIALDTEDGSWLGCQTALGFGQSMALCKWL